MSDPPPTRDLRARGFDGIGPASQAQPTALDRVVADPDRLARETTDVGGSRRLTRLGEPHQDSDTDALRARLAAPASERLQVLGEHARGGMGTVMLAADSTLSRRLAMKVMHRELAGDAGVLRLFLREARITAQLEHPHIVPVHELGEDAEGRVFFTMRLIEGSTLRDRISALTTRPPRGEALVDLLDVVLRVCDALAFAHSRGVLHCDLKPSNVMLGDYGEVYLMDWGIALIRDASRAREDSDPDADGSRVIMGTAAYMSPEQALGRRDSLDERADVFSMGALLYHLLAGRPPYEGDSFTEALEKAAAVEVRPLSEVLPGRVPRELERIVNRAMAPARRARYASVDALRQDLLRFMRGTDEFPVRRVEAGARVLAEGEVGNEAYIIESGGVEVSRGEGAERTVLRTLGPGEVVGETAVLTQAARNADVTATEPTVLRVLDRARLEDELASMKPWMGALLRNIAER